MLSMPRGKRKQVDLTIDEQIQQTKEQIDDLNEQLKKKKAELKTLETAKADEEKNKLIAAIAESGKSYDEIMAMLKGK